MKKQQAKIVLIYSHKDRVFFDRTTFLDFLKGMAKEEGASLWWDKKMRRTLWDEEIKQQLYDADVIICLISQSFITSDYIMNAEAKKTFDRLKREGIIVIGIML